MEFTLGHELLDKGEPVSVQINKEVGEHSRLAARLRLAAEDTPNRLAELIGAEVRCRFRDGEAEVDLFAGIVAELKLVDADFGKPETEIEVVAWSHSWLADLVPKFRVFQEPKQTLGDIVDRVIKESAASGRRSGSDLSINVPLAVQYDESDFAFLRRLLTVSGIPIVVDDVSRVFLAGVPAREPARVAESELTERVVRARLSCLLSDESFATRPGALRELQEDVKRFVSRVGDEGHYYNATTIHREAAERTEEAQSKLDLSKFSGHLATMEVKTRRTFAGVGDRLQLPDGGIFVVAAASFLLDYSGRRLSASQSYELWPSNTLLPRFSDRSPVPDTQGVPTTSRSQGTVGDAYTVPWQSRIFVAEVTRNEGDPEEIGRVQVRFDWEDGGGDSEMQCWLDVMTPFAGSAEETHGFFMLPERGEKVLVRFLEPWDDKPVIVGSLRRRPVVGGLDGAKHKFIRTPGGNSVEFFSHGTEEIVRLRAGEGDQFNIVVNATNGKTNVAIQCDESIQLSGKEITLRGERVSLQADSLEMNGKKTASIATDGELEMNGSGKVKVRSRGAVSVKGQLIELN